MLLTHTILPWGTAIWIFATTVWTTRLLLTAKAPFPSTNERLRVPEPDDAPLVLAPSGDYVGIV